MLYNNKYISRYCMSLPKQVVHKIKSIPMDPLALANNVQLAYMLSFSNYTVSSDSAQCSPKDSYNSPLEVYNFVDFDEPTYQTLYAQTKKNYELKNSTAVKSIRNSFKQFYTRVSAMTYSTALKKDEFLSTPSPVPLKIPSFQAQFKIDQMRGNNPNDWPRNLKQFHEEINKLPWNAFACQPQIYFQDFFSQSFQALKNFIKKINNDNRSDIIKDISTIVEIITIISLKTNNQTFILTQYEALASLDLDKIFNQKQMRELVSKLQKISTDIFQKIPVNQEQEYHALKKIFEKDSAFMIMKKIHFQKQNGLGFYTVTNDGTYLYIYVSSINGGMFKIGTGKNGSIAGKIYLQREVTLPVGSKLDQINWVFLKDKLYLKTSTREPSSLQVINPDNFKTQGIIQLKCKSLFGHQSLTNINRNSILLTDGQKLYMLGKQLEIKQTKYEKKEQKKQQKKEQKEEQKKQQGQHKRKKKKQKNQQNAQENQNKQKINNVDQIDKIIQFVLVEFDPEGQDPEYQSDQKLIQELFMSFNNYFTINQCKKALFLNQNDISEAAQWLVQQGQKQRGTKVLYPTNKVVICQSQITSNFSEKNIKSSNQLMTKQGSLLHTQNIHQLIWTMDEDQITCYSDTGLKIFSKSSIDCHKINENSQLQTTHLKTFAQQKSMRNPEYTISYDPYNKVFYTFTWPTDGAHYFPTAVLIQADQKHVAELSHQKKINLSQTEPRSFTEFSRWLLVKMSMLDNNHCPEQGRTNNWLWYFAQKIIEINRQINTNNDSDKKKLTNKRSKILTKMNRINEYYKVYQKQKQQFQEKGKVINEIKLVPPFACDGSFENLEKIRNAFGKQLEPEYVYDFIFTLEKWLQNSPKVPSQKIKQFLFKIRQELTNLRDQLNRNTLKKLNNLLIEHFFQFFESVSQQQQFIIKLDKTEIDKFIEKHHNSRHKQNRSIIYETKTKENILQKYDSKNIFEQIFPVTSNVSMKSLYEDRSIGNLLINSKNDHKKQKNVLIKFLEKEILNSSNGIKLFQYIFLEAFRNVVKQPKVQQYYQQLQELFLQTFKLILNVASQANFSLLKILSDPINQIVQLYFASLCSINSSLQITEILLKLLEQMQKKQVLNLFSFIEDMEFQGISQTFQKIHQTPHPIQRGRNQNFPQMRNSQASLIYAQFDKRCHTDSNNDYLSIQLLHQGNPAGNAIVCGDGVFSTNLRLSGKIDSGKPYLIMGNSISIDFASSGHAKDAKSFGRFGFKFGLRPIYAGKIKYKKNGYQKIQKIFNSKSQFEKYVNMLKLLTITISNSIQNLVQLQKQEHQNPLIAKFLSGKIFKQGYQQLNSNAIGAKNSSQSISSHIDNLLSQKNKNKADGRLYILKLLHADSLKKDPQKVNQQKKDNKQIKQIKQSKKQVKKIQKKEEKKQQESSQKISNQNEEDIWDLEGVPGYIKSYVEKIRNFNGTFIDVFMEARQLALPKGIYATELRKSGFTEQMKKLWLQGEAILFLTVLKHSGLLHLQIKFSIEYIKANLKAFQQARNGIFESFIRRMQSTRQWRDLLQTFQGQKQTYVQQQKTQKQPQKLPQQKIGGVQIKKKGMATKTIKLENNRKGLKNEKKIEKKQEQEPAKQSIQSRRNQIQKTIRQRLTEDNMIRPLCAIKNIEYTPKQTFQNVTRIIQLLQQQSAWPIPTQSVYIAPIVHLIKSCLFLLKLKSSSAKHHPNQEEELEPEDLFRSYSQDQRHVNTNKVNIFRQWLENWKKWKDFRKEEGKVQLRFPVSEIVQFINFWGDISKFKAQIEGRTKIAIGRIKFYELTNWLLKTTSNSFLSKYALGAQVANIKGSFNSNLQSVSSIKMQQLGQKHNEYSVTLKQQQEKKFKQLPLSLQSFTALMSKTEGEPLQALKLTTLHLYLIESENPNIDLQTALYLLPLKYLNNTSQQLIYVVSLLLQRAFIGDHDVNTILAKLWKEVGNDTISCRRWRDYFFIQRLLFLFRKLQHKVRSNKIQIGDKVKISEALFYIIYHIDVPIVWRVCLRILNSLKIPLTRDIPMPFSRSYRKIAYDNNSNAGASKYKVQVFKMQNSYQNNLQMLANKCYQVFKGQFKNQVREKMLGIESKQSRKHESSNQITQIQKQSHHKQKPHKQEAFCIILNMNQQEDIAWMITVLYYLQEVQKTINPIKDWQQYASKKNKKKEHHKQKQPKQAKQNPQANTNTVHVQEKQKKSIDQRILLNIPNANAHTNLPIPIPDEIQSTLPTGWFFNYCNIYNSIQFSKPGLQSLNLQNLAPNLAQKKGKNANQAINQNSARKAWNSVQFMKLYKKFQELTTKPLEEPKEEEGEENKVQFIKAKNFISRMRKHCNEVSIIFSNLSQNGFYVFREDVPKQKCQIICQLFSLGGQYRLKPIPFDFKLKDYPTKLSPVYPQPQKKSELKITCIKSKQYRKFNQLINAPNFITTRADNNPLLYYTNLGLNQYTFEDKCHLPYQQLPQLQSDQDNIKIQFSKYFVQSSFSRMKKRHDEVYLKQYPKLRYFLSQGGLESGLVQATLVPTFDSSLACQKSNVDQIFPTSPKYQTEEDPEQLLSKTIKLLSESTPFPEITKKDQIIPYVLLCCYIEKLSKVSMQFIDSSLLKQFQQKISKFISGLTADHSIQEYKQKIQVLTTKMLDSQNKALSQFRLYRFDEDHINPQLAAFVDNDRMRSSLKQDNISTSQQTLQSHQCPKSNYLLPTHTPIPQQNKLLKYWQKNILPKILQFVKNSLKPLQIDDFFEQMRIPLRKSDQMEAKKVAYVICDNKLPAGAVLPDSNHNWNSLTIQDVNVGQDVLLRLPKSRSESSSPLMCSQNHQHRVGQIMFIDQKNFSALVRHRINQYAIFVYSWVPINSLEAVEQSLAHYSLQTIYRKLEQSLKGIIYNYSKICLTSISKKIKINTESLIEQTIIDMFRDNPISGWNEEKNWLLKSTLKAQLSEGNNKVVEMIQNKFCPVQSYDVDLFSQKIMKLNRFDNCLGLIVSFKKASQLVWYSGIKFYSDQYGFKQIADIYASKSCVNQLQPLQFKNPNVYSIYYNVGKQFLKAVELQKHEQKQLMATIFAVDTTWTVSTYLANVIGQIAVQENRYEDILIRFNRLFLKWLQKRQAIYLSSQLCRLITKNTLRIKKICSEKKISISLDVMGTCEQQIRSFLEWINLLKEEQEKDILVLYSPLLQNLIEMVASLLSGLQKLLTNLPTEIQQVIKMIHMISEIQNNLNGKRTKKQAISNEKQWQRILVIQNTPSFINEKQLKEKIKSILVKNNAKILAPSFDIFYSNGQAVILVDSWDVTELVEEQIMEKIENEQQKQPEPEEDQGLLMQWACQFCTIVNPNGNTHCSMCESPAPVPKAAQIFYEVVQSKDVNKAQQKLREKERKRFDNVKQQIKAFIDQAWKQQCKKIDAAKQAQQKQRQQKRKKKGKMVQSQQKKFDKPPQPSISLSSGSEVLEKKIVEQFLQNRYGHLPQSITKKVSKEAESHLMKFKELSKLGYDLWGDHISSETPNLLNFEYLSQLMQYIQDQICKGSSSVLSYNESSIRMINQIPLLKEGHDEPLNFIAQNNLGVKMKYKKLSEQKSYNIRYSWKIIKQLNLAASKCLVFTNMSLVPNEGGQVICSTNTLGANLKCLRQLIMGALKLQLFQKIMQKTSVILEAQDIPKITLERLKLREQANQKGNKLISSKDRDDFLFTKAHEQLQKVSSINMRPFKPKGTEPYLSFSVNFKNQLVQGQAGPYRQFFTDISNQLNPDNGLNLFIKTPNNIHKTGEGRSKWTINPKANSTYYLSLFHFLGRLMGCCIRTGLHLPIDLANFCWKLIADQKIKQSDADQLDHQFYQQSKQLLQCPSQSTFDSMEEEVGEPVTWVYTTVDGEQLQLKPNGKTERVLYDERAYYVAQMQRKRIQQISLQVKKIREGLYQMIPQSFLNHISGQELKTMICGIPKVDVQLLKKHTKYAGNLNEETPIIKHFWQMMKQIKQEQRLKFIRFCWGQQRLPLNSQQFERNGVRFMIKPMLNKQNPDQALPKADTCFFNIELPPYSTKQILKNRILLAINLDNVSINGDRDIQPDDNPLMGNVEYEDEGEEEDDGEGGGGGG